MKNMRKIDRQMTSEETLVLLNRCQYGILSTVDKEYQPYGTPVSYINTGDKIYFHCALEGTKLENISNNPKVCFTVVGDTKLLPDKFSTEYESVMAFGKTSVVEGEEKIFVLREIIKKYSPDFIEAGEQYINRATDKTCVIRIDIDNITGKHRV